MIKNVDNLRRVRWVAALVLILAGSPSTTAAYGYQLLKDQVYAQRASDTLKGDLYLPETDGTVPAVIMIHGGGWSSGNSDDMGRFARRVVKSGFAVFNVSYRLAPDNKFPAQLRDVRDAVRWLRTRAAEYHIDPERIGAWGYSAGAHLAMLLGTVSENALPDANVNAPSARVSAVVAGAGPSDLREYPDNRYVVGLMPTDADDALFDLASPVAAVTSDDAPMFLYHGRHDKIVDFHNSVNMYHTLKNVGVAAHLYETHFGHILTYLFEQDAVGAAIEFLRSQLQSSRSDT